MKYQVIFLHYKTGQNFTYDKNICFSYESAFFAKNVTREKLRKALSYEKCVHKMLIKLTPGRVRGRKNKYKDFLRANPIKFYFPIINLELCSSNVQIYLRRAQQKTV